MVRIQFYTLFYEFRAQIRPRLPVEWSPGRPAISLDTHRTRPSHIRTPTADSVHSTLIPRVSSSRLFSYLSLPSPFFWCFSRFLCFVVDVFYSFFSYFFLHDCSEDEKKAQRKANTHIADRSRHLELRKKLDTAERGRGLR